MQTPPFDLSLVRMLEEKLEEINQQTKLHVRELHRMEDIIHAKEEECEDLETRCTAIIYSIAEDVERCRRLQDDYNSIKVLASLTPEVPGFLKALAQ